MTMAQPYQSVGQVSDELEAIVANHEGWPDDSVRPFADQVTSHDLSFRADRANYQLYGLDGHEPMAAHSEPPMAGRQVEPFDDTQESA